MTVTRSIICGSTSRRFYSSWLVSFALCYLASNTEQAKASSVVLLNTDHLPKVFKDHNVLETPSKPSLSDNDYSNQLDHALCFKTLGCITQVPGFATPEQPDELDTKFSLFSRRTTETNLQWGRFETRLNKSDLCEQVIFPLDLGEILKAQFDLSLRTIVIIGSYREDSPADWQIETKNKWLALEDVNVIIVSWPSISRNFKYTRALSTMKLLARQVVILLYYLHELKGLNVRDGYQTNRLYLIGYSLGSHIASFISKDLNPSLIGRITALDPSDLKDVSAEYRLNPNDAHLVDVLHTRKSDDTILGAYSGTLKHMGHLDYFANDGINEGSYGVLRNINNLAARYYVAVLNYELQVRLILGSKLRKKYHRLLAFTSLDYNEFHTGKSLSQLCPITTLDDNDVLWPDIYQCTVPIDYVSPFEAFRQELVADYNINFEHLDKDGLIERSQQSISNPGYYFYAKQNEPYLNNHNLIKLRIAQPANQQPPQHKSDIASNEQDSSTLETVRPKCDIVITLRSRPNFDHEVLPPKDKHHIKSYELIDAKDHYEVIVPFQSAVFDLGHKLSLVDLDMNSDELDANNTETLKLHLLDIFPYEINIQGLSLDPDSSDGTSGSKEGGLFNLLGSFLDWATGRDPIDDYDDKNSEDKCLLSVETVTIEPLQKLHRHVVATYSLGANLEVSPNLVVLEKDQATPRVDLYHRKKNNDDVEKINNDETDQARSAQVKHKRIILDTIVIGPRVTSLNHEILKDDDNEFDGTAGEESQLPVDSSSVSSGTWIMLTVLSVVLFGVCGGFLLCKMSQLPIRSSQIPIDKVVLNLELPEEDAAF